MSEFPLTNFHYNLHHQAYQPEQHPPLLQPIPGHQDPEKDQGVRDTVKAVVTDAIESGKKVLRHDKKTESPKQDRRGLDDLAEFGQTVLQTGVLGSKGRYAGTAIGVARREPDKKYGGVLGTAAASGLLGHNSQVAARAMGMGKTKDEGGMTSKSVLNSGLFNKKEKTIAGATIKLVKGRIGK